MDAEKRGLPGPQAGRRIAAAWLAGAALVAGASEITEAENLSGQLVP